MTASLHDNVTAHVTTSEAPTTTPTTNDGTGPNPVAVAVPVTVPDETTTTTTTTTTAATATTCGLKVTTDTEFATVSHDCSIDHFSAVTTLYAPSHPDGKNRAGMDVVLCCDRSGSMYGEKMATLHKTVQLMIEQLQAIDRLSLVAYDDRVERTLELTAMDTKGKEAALAALATIRDRGCTNLSGGLLEGLSVLEERVGPKNEVSSVLLLTDGLANRGITSQDQLIDVTDKKVKGMQNPTSVYTFGYGVDHNSELLNGIAKAANGSYYFMRTTDSIMEAFADCMGGLMSVVAQNIKMHVEVADNAPDVSIHDIFTSFDKTVVTPGKRYKVAIGDIFSEEQKDLLLDLKLPACDNPDEEQVLIKVHVKYFNVMTAEDEECTSTMSLRRSAKGTPNGALSQRVAEQRARLDTRCAMDEAQQQADMGNLELARLRLHRCEQQVQAVGAGQTWARGYTEDLKLCQRNMGSSSQYRSVGKNRLASKSRKHGIQRANHCDREETDLAETSSAMYMNCQKRQMKGMFGFK